MIRYIIASCLLPVSISLSYITSITFLYYICQLDLFLLIYWKTYPVSTWTIVANKIVCIPAIWLLISYSPATNFRRISPNYLSIVACLHIKSINKLFYKKFIIHWKIHFLLENSLFIRKYVINAF